jgi:PAS domain S-box-containing protein
MVLTSLPRGNAMKLPPLPNSPALIFHATGIAAAVVGVAAILTWHSDASPFYAVQRVPYGAAFALILYGIAVGLSGLKRFAIANVFASVLLILGVARLLESLLRTNAGLDLFFSQYGVLAEPHRTGVLTAFSFALLAVALITLGRRQPGKPALIAVSLIATAVLAISLTTFAGWVSYGLFDWLDVAGIRVPSALVLLILSASVIAYVFSRVEHGISIVRWAPLAVGMGIFVGALVLWQALVLWETRRVQQEITWSTYAVSAHLKARVKEQIAILERLAARWKIYEPTEQQWRADAEATARSTHYLGIAWYDKGLQPRWTSLPDDVKFAPPRTQTPSLSEFLVLDSGEQALRVYLPVWYRGQFDGVIAGTLEVRELVRDVLLESQPGFSLALFEGDRLIVSFNEYNPMLAKRWGVEQAISLYNAEWVLRVAPAEEFLEMAHARLPEVVLVSGLLVSALLAITIFFYQSARGRALEAETANASLARETEERKKTERRTQDAMEYYFRLFTDFPSLVRRTDVNGQCDYCNEAWLKYTGRSLEQDLGAGWMQSVHPEDSQLCIQTIGRAFNSRQPLELEYRLRRSDGQYGWVRDFGKPVYDIEGHFIGYLNTCHDITASKQSQLALERSRKRLRALSAHLQTAREDEKMRLARQLHDEFGAKLTALKLDLGWLTSKLPSDPPVREKAAAMGEALDTALNGMRKIWSELRPSVLDDLGLVAALRWEAREFRNIWRIPVTVRAEEEDVPADIGLALYRILQEALANIAVHAKASQVVITFRASAEAWTLEIRDDGVGVDERRILADDRGGYGLSAMGERAHALNGVVTVKRATGRGTVVTAVIPRPVPKQAA